jgi:uncharacterized membrane protein
MSYDSDRQAGTEKPDEFMVTPAMIEAGVAVLREYLPDDAFGPYSSSEICARLYSSMASRL